MAEEEIKKENILYKIIPTPTEILKSCGLSIIIESLETYNKMNINDNIKSKGIYLIKDGKYMKVN
jgi:hypothetical protein